MGSYRCDYTATKITIPPEVWVELYSELASYILQYSSLDSITEIDENGDERYTEEKQDEYNCIADEVETILETFFIKRESKNGSS